MKLGTIASTNLKGQVVIPKDMRDALGITSHVALMVQLHGKGIYIHPIEDVITKVDTESSYVQLLQKTQGAWAHDNDSRDTLQAAKSKLELKASKNRKRAW